MKETWVPMEMVVSDFYAFASFPVRVWNESAGIPRWKQPDLSEHWIPLVFRQTFLEFGWELYEIMIFVDDFQFFFCELFFTSTRFNCIFKMINYSTAGVSFHKPITWKTYFNPIFFLLLPNKKHLQFSHQPGKQKQHIPLKPQPFCGLPLVGFRWFSGGSGTTQGDDVYVYGWTFEESVSGSGGGWVVRVWSDFFRLFPDNLLESWEKK